MSSHPTTIAKIALELNSSLILNYKKKGQVEIIHIVECLELIWTASNSKITYVNNIYYPGKVMDCDNLILLLVAFKK